MCLSEMAPPAFGGSAGLAGGSAGLAGAAFEESRTRNFNGKETSANVSTMTRRMVMTLYLPDLFT